MLTNNEEQLFNQFKISCLDGFAFCKLTNTFFSEVNRTPDAGERLRARKGRIKEFLEEIIPLSIYIRSVYKIGLDLSVSWQGFGNQPYDAIIKRSGIHLEIEPLPSQVFIEITTAEHEKEFRVRELLNRDGFCFAPKGIDDSNRLQIVSSCVSYDDDELIQEALLIIRKSILKKNSKPYPDHTVLIVRCDLSICNDKEWRCLEAKIRASMTDFIFLEIFIYDSATERFFILKNPSFKNMRKTL